MKKKIVQWSLIGIASLVILAGIFVIVFTGTTIKHSVQIVGSTVTKCNVTVENVDFSLIKGILTIDNLVVGNPEGYKSANAFSLTKVHISLEPLSFLTNKIHIREIQVIDPQVTYEVGLLETNIGKLLDNVSRFSGDKKDAKEDKNEETKAEEPEKIGTGKDVQVDHVLFEGGKVTVTAKLLNGKAGVPIPLPGCELRDLGKDEKITIVPLVAKVLKSMRLSVISVAK